MRELSPESQQWVQIFRERHLGGRTVSLDEGLEIVDQWVEECADSRQSGDERALPSRCLERKTLRLEFWHQNAHGIWRRIEEVPARSVPYALAHAAEKVDRDWKCDMPDAVLFVVSDVVVKVKSRLSMRLGGVAKRDLNRAGLAIAPDRPVDVWKDDVPVNSGLSRKLGKGDRAFYDWYIRVRESLIAANGEEPTWSALLFELKKDDSIRRSYATPSGLAQAIHRLERILAVSPQGKVDLINRFIEGP